MITTQEVLQQIKELTALAHYRYWRNPHRARIELALDRTYLLLAARALEPTPAQDKELEDWTENALLFEDFAAGRPLGSGLFETDAPQRKAYAAIASAYRALIAAAERSPTHE